MTDTLIRPARPSDAAQIVHFIHEHARDEGAGDYVTITQEKLIERAFSARPRVEILVVEEAGRLIGQVLFQEVFSSWKGELYLFVEDIFLSPSARGKGFGEKLIGQVARIAKERGAPRVDLTVDRENPRAQAFYKRLGFYHIESWLYYRLEGEALAKAAAV